MSWHVQEIEDSALRLLCVDGLGGATLTELVRRAGGLNEAGEAVLQGDARSWLPSGASEILRERMLRMEIDPARWSAEAVEANIVVVMDDDFPRLLTPLPACPAALWYRGEINVLDMPAVAIVGSRRCSSYGISQATEFAKAIVQADICVVSGGARGIDGAAHRSALRHDGKTVCVLGAGLRVPYPPEHAGLFDTIVDSGSLVLSEFPCHTPPRPAYFPRRNRIVSGLASVTLVVEAARRSGALITARIAVEEHGRQAMAIPGRIGDPASAGCLHAIRDGFVGMAIEPIDVVEEAIEAWGRLGGTCANDCTTRT